MKNSIIMILYLVISVLFIASGCSDNFLETEDPGKLSTTEFYKTDDDALKATTAVYDMMSASNTWGWQSLYMLKTMPSDESNAGGASAGDQPGYQSLDKFTFDSQNDIVLKVWRALYYAINRANKVINNVQPENNLRKRLIAEAKTLRAYNYFQLVSLWGGVPLILNDLKPSEFTTQKRANKEDVYAQLRKDLTEAIPNLPEKGAYGEEDKFRVSKGTAQAILGKAYLYQEKWSKAADQFDDVISSNQYYLAPDFGIIFSKEGEFGPGSIFEFSYNMEINSPYGRARETNYYIQLMGIIPTYYTKAPGDSLAGGGWGFNEPTAKLYDAFVDARDSARRVNTVMSVADLRSKGGDWTNPDYYDFEGVLRRKYGSYSTERNSSDSRSFGTNWREIRYADVLLMDAEAYYRTGDEGRARVELNKVRKRTQLPDVTASGNALFEAIVTERQLELAFEEVRYQDLIRWGRAAQELGPLGFVKGKNELLPIPQEEVKSGGLTQNPRY